MIAMKMNLCVKLIAKFIKFGPLLEVEQCMKSLLDVASGDHKYYPIIINSSYLKQSYISFTHNACTPTMPLQCLRFGIPCDKLQDKSCLTHEN